MSTTPFTSDRQIYLDSNGKPVESSHGDKQILFMGSNATIGYEQALEMKIIDIDGVPFYERYETQAFNKPAETQAFPQPSGRDVMDRLVEQKKPRRERERKSA